MGLSSLIEILLGFYSYLLPIALYAAWLGIALWDIAHRDKMKPGPRYGWMAAIVAIPIFGAIAYYMFGKPALSPGISLDARRWHFWHLDRCDDDPHCLSVRCASITR